MYYAINCKIASTKILQLSWLNNRFESSSLCVRDFSLNYSIYTNSQLSSGARDYPATTKSHNFRQFRHYIYGIHTSHTRPIFVSTWTANWIISDCLRALLKFISVRFSCAPGWIGKLLSHFDDEREGLWFSSCKNERRWASVPVSGTSPLRTRRAPAE